MIITLQYTVSCNRIIPEVETLVTDIGNENPETVLRELRGIEKCEGTWEIIPNVPDLEVTHEFTHLGDLLEIPWYKRKNR